MPFELPALPYALNALEPYISQETLEYHYGKHHQAYVNNLNNLLPNSNFEGATLEEIIQKSSGGIFNNAAQVWNHTFYWHSMRPQGGGEPTGALLEAINRKFGTFAQFKADFTKAAITLFGSGWAWLVKNSDGSVEIFNTSNADTPMVHGKQALLTCDVWEHAYYIDVRNLRPNYVENFWQLVNWDFVSKNFSQ